jgi:hypothetical protein
VLVEENRDDQSSCAHPAPMLSGAVDGDAASSAVPVVKLEASDAR